MPLFREKKETPGGLGAGKKGPDLYSSARRVQTTSKNWWNSPGMKKARRQFWKKLGRGASDMGSYMWNGE
jgi:hypothetical protein